MIWAVIAGIMVGKAFECLNKKDVEGFLSHRKDDAVLLSPENLSMITRFPILSLDVKNIYLRDIFAFGPSNGAIVEFSVKGKTDDDKS